MSWARILPFLAVMSFVVAVIHCYLWLRLVRDPNWSDRWQWLLMTGLIFLAVLLPLGMLLSRALPRELIFPTSWLAFVWMGMMFLLVAQLLGLDVIRFGYWVLRMMRGQEFDPSRREFISRGVAIGVGSIAVLTSGIGLWQAIRPLYVKQVKVRIPRLPNRLEGYRILQMTDVHVGPLIGKNLIEQLVEKCNALKADAIAITGDLVDGSVESLQEHVRPLGKLRAKDGVFFVTGNHEYYSGAVEWVKFLSEDLGIHVLRNECVSIERDGAGLDIAGVDDHSAEQFGGGHGANLKKALKDRNADRPVVLLAHQPKQIGEAAELGVDLQLSGHTHGGQIFPFNYLVKLQQPYVQGLHQHGKSQIYVSPGTGFWGPPMRVGTRAEITEIELTAGS